MSEYKDKLLKHIQCLEDRILSSLDEDDISERTQQFRQGQLAMVRLIKSDVRANLKPLG